MVALKWSLSLIHRPFFSVGWHREVVIRNYDEGGITKDGRKSSTLADTYYYTPCKRKLVRSEVEIMDTDCFPVWDWHEIVMSLMMDQKVVMQANLQRITTTYLQYTGEIELSSSILDSSNSIEEAKNCHKKDVTVHHPLLGSNFVGYCLHVVTFWLLFLCSLVTAKLHTHLWHRIDVAHLLHMHCPSSMWQLCVFWFWATGCFLKFFFSYLLVHKKIIWRNKKKLVLKSIQ